MKTRPLLTNQDARRLFLDRHLLLGPTTGPAKGPPLEALLIDLGFVQLDSVNTLARAHDLILWSRRTQYRPQGLDDLVAQHRAGFEHWTHDAAVIPMRFYPMWRLKFQRDEARIKRLWPKWRQEGWDAEVENVLQHILDFGPVGAADLGGETPKGSGGWWNWHPSKTALEYLWRSGRLSVCHRQGFRKIYDLTERVIPADHLRASVADDEVIDWAMMAALTRLGFGTSTELAAFFNIANLDEAKLWCANALRLSRIIEIDVEMADGSRRLCYSTAELLEKVASLPQPSARIRLLSPFDPALRDRQRAERLFGFRYRIEIFVPAAKRQYGYYVFPVLQGDRLIGRIDAKRESGVLAVRAFWPEPGLRMGQGRINALTAELWRIAPLAGISEVSFSPDWLRA
ncbi:winged helix-turn-helix domain-containing protein [Paracoccus sp. (in: a-proteobacteria)]|uniref:winged helix-turn-helix domain-containing protein n=1 Tax=Paracoccus sp. TaxID=267 RepID=UPI0028A1A72A|nr:crosslink repair DNA glycosylase YcaQ family protein [Paracoccus sp. (in: a-proteobacteria)]